MKTLTNHVIVYDAECPACRAYTGFFVKTGMLESNGREPYHQLPQHLNKLLDTQRARNEIALVNTQTGFVYYGTESLLAIVGNRFPLLNKLFSLPPLRWLLRLLYTFVSYNRRIILPPKPASIQNSCAPDFNIGFRTLYLIVTWLIVSAVLNQFSQLLTGVVPPSHFFREWLICGGQLVFQSLVLMFRRTKPMLLVEYLGNMMTVSLGGAILLLPLLLVSSFTVVHPMLALAWFMFVVLLMLLEHLRRSSILGLGWIISATWVLYRLMVLLLIV